MIEIEYAKIRSGSLDPDAGRAVADDDAAPRRALLAERCSFPGGYAGLFRRDHDGPERDDAWEQAVAALFDEHAGIDDPDEAAPDDRVVVYDAMPDGLRTEWDRLWRADAHAWVDAVPDPYGQGIGDRGPDAWQQAARFGTTDGGLLVLCPYDDFFGAAAWCEAVRFGFHEVAAAVGVSTPTRWTVD